MSHATSSDVESFRRVIARALGLAFEDGKLDWLASVLARRLVATRLPAATYLRHLEDTSDELAQLAVELTVGETYFLRHFDQFRAFADLLRSAATHASPNRPIRVLSAGCSSGEEPYSLAMMARETLDPATRVEIVAVDVNPAALARARRANYKRWALRETPSHLERRWFRSEGSECVPDASVRSMVRFEQRNLADDNADLWIEPFDVVFCRNVLMYLTSDAARALVRRIARALPARGHLFIGYAETLRVLSDDFYVCHTHGTFYYRRREARDAGQGRAEDALPSTSDFPLVPPSDGPPSDGPPSDGPPSDGPPSDGPASDWMDAIRACSERIDLLAQAPSPESKCPATQPPPLCADVDRALSLFSEERFADALSVLDSSSNPASRDPEVALLRAVLLTQQGNASVAEEICADLLEAGEHVAGARYLLALCRDAAGDISGAADHDRIAVATDPTFAMAHMHLGLLARRTSDVETARREIESAVLLLEREPASRLLLFGGGFGRDSLIALCRAELDALGRAS